MSDSTKEPALTAGGEASGVFVEGRRSVRSIYRRMQEPQAPRAGKHAEHGHELGLMGGLAALSLDALSSVAYGPEAMALVLVAAGTGALTYTLPLTLVITAMLALLVVSYSQVIAVTPRAAAPTRWPRRTSAAGRACSRQPRS